MTTQGNRRAGNVTRRRFLQATAVGFAAGWSGLRSSYAAPAGGQANELRVTERGIDLVIARTPISISGREGSAIAINGMVPAPLLRMREGETAVMRVTNRLDNERTSIHWHGMLVPTEMDGVQGISFPGIEPGDTFTYRFRVRQNGTYWYHSHSGLQEQLGHYGPIVIEPAHLVGHSQSGRIAIDLAFAYPQRIAKAE